ncbi:S24 family peptidase [bacterium]|nr:S24 family peptidase [bacterium]NCQ54966.1 S24 family peptidase [Candidatus Parcubacteria bacterium]NCS67010.1 S24 family peptidase [Candidatus Peregrinibacteria bacterium]NCS95956.1 S24 family peptidase [bacterium]
MRTKPEIVDYVLNKMSQKKLTKSGLGQALGANGGAQAKVQRANGFLSPKSDKVNMADLFLVAQFLGVDPKDIILHEVKEKEINSDLPDYNINPNHLVPLVSSAANTEESDDLKEWLIYPYDNSAHKKIVAITMPDNRMAPMIKKGEILFVDNRLYSFSLSDRLILATYGNEFIVGRFRRLENGQVQIYFDDPLAEPVVYSTDNEHLEIVGVVISRFCETN